MTEFLKRLVDIEREPDARHPRAWLRATHRAVSLSRLLQDEADNDACHMKVVIAFMISESLSPENCGKDEANDCSRYRVMSNVSRHVITIRPMRTRLFQHAQSRRTGRFSTSSFGYISCPIGRSPVDACYSLRSVPPTSLAARNSVD